MKIIYCIAGTRHSGGMERVLANKANWLTRHGHEVHIVTTDQCGEKPFFEMNEGIKLYDLGINYEENNGRSLVNKIIKYPFKQFWHKRRLTSLLLGLKADIVVSMGCNDSSFLYNIKDGSKKLLEIHFSRMKRIQYGRKGLWGIVDKFRSTTEKKTASKYERFIVLTNEDKELWGVDMDNIIVIPNAHTFRLPTPSSCEHKTVLAVGRFTHQKAFDQLIDVWRILKEKPLYADWKLRIVGDGELRSDYTNMIARYGLGDSITLVGLCHDISLEYLQSSLYVLTSKYEGLPMALLEAQASGLPIVSFACKCGPRDIITDGIDGYIVEEGDINGMVGRMELLMANVDLRKQFGRAAYENSLSYTADSVMKRWLNLFLELCSPALS